MSSYQSKYFKIVKCHPGKLAYIFTSVMSRASQEHKQAYQATFPEKKLYLSIDYEQRKRKAQQTVYEKSQVYDANRDVFWEKIRRKIAL